MRTSVKYRQVDRTTLNAHIAEMYENAGRAHENRVRDLIWKDQPLTANQSLEYAERYYRTAAEYTK